MVVNIKLISLNLEFEELVICCKVLLSWMIKSVIDLN